MSQEPTEELDWGIVADAKPKGCVQKNAVTYTFYGPVTDVVVNGLDDEVEIHVSWSVSRPLENGLLTEEGWEPFLRMPHIFLKFRNFTVPFVFEDTPKKGPRVRFGTGVLYLLERSIEIDPRTIPGLLIG